MKQVILITGSSSGMGELAAKALARAGHTVYASMRESTEKNAEKADSFRRFSKEHRLELIPLELDVTSDVSAEQAVQMIVADRNRIDVLIHNAGHMTYGPLEAFTPEQLAILYDINVVSTQRLNRAVLPIMRKPRSGLLIWNSSSSAAGGATPYLGPYFAAKAGMDALAAWYAPELTRWGIETSIVVPGAFTKGTNHFGHATAPLDAQRAAEYDDGPYHGLGDQINAAIASIMPADADVTKVADAIVAIVATPRGKRPHRVHIDTIDDGAIVVNGVLDRVRAQMLQRTGLADLLTVQQ